MFQPSVLPEPLTAVLGEVRAWRDSPSSTNAEERIAWVAGLRQLVDAAEAVYLHALGDMDAHGDPALLHGARSTASWLQSALHLAPGEASSQVKVARASRDVLGASLEDLTAGRVTTGHLAAIERSLRHLPREATPEAAKLLGDLAPLVDVGRLRTAGRAFQHAVDPDGALRDCEKQFDRRYLQLAPLLDGMVRVDGLLDSEGAAAVDAALAPFLVPAGEHDLRTAAQRRADGFVDVARSAMDSDSPATLSGQPVQLQVLVPWGVLVPESNPRTGQCVNPHVAMLGQSPREGLPLTATAAQRLGCDASVARLIFDPDGVVLDLGRSQRLFSPAQRRALAVRDGGCRFPGCTRPPRFSDAHHVVPWSRGGASDLVNALLLCRYHHRLVHEGGWKVVSAETAECVDANASIAVIGPNGQRFTEAARGP